jgi:hypothetical protein
VTDLNGATSAAPSGAVRFDERLSAPLWWWIPGLGVIALLVITVRLGHPTWPMWLPAVVLLPLLAITMVRTGRIRVTVVDDAEGRAVLTVGPATLPARFISGVTVVAAKDKQPVLGPELDPAAYVVHRPWIGPMVQVTLDDPADPTPYWLFSVRHPEALAESLRAVHDQSDPRVGQDN